MKRIKIMALLVSMGIAATILLSGCEGGEDDANDPSKLPATVVQDGKTYTKGGGAIYRGPNGDIYGFNEEGRLVPWNVREGKPR